MAGGTGGMAHRGRKGGERNGSIEALRIRSELGRLNRLLLFGTKDLTWAFLRGASC
jgi:hypothetical protein